MPRGHRERRKSVVSRNVTLIGKSQNKRRHCPARPRAETCGCGFLAFLRAREESRAPPSPRERVYHPSGMENAYRTKPLATATARAVRMQANAGRYCCSADILPARSSPRHDQSLAFLARARAHRGRDFPRKAETLILLRSIRFRSRIPFRPPPALAGEGTRKELAFLARARIRPSSPSGHIIIIPFRFIVSLRQDVGPRQSTRDEIHERKPLNSPSQLRVTGGCPGSDGRRNETGQERVEFHVRRGASGSLPRRGGGGEMVMEEGRGGSARDARFVRVKW